MKITAMESQNTQGDQIPKSTQIIPTRTDEVDIIKGANDTSSIDATQKNVDEIDLGNESVNISSETATILPREEERNTIHNLIENSENHDHHAASPSTGQGTHHNEGRRG